MRCVSAKQVDNTATYLIQIIKPIYPIPTNTQVRSHSHI